jgi:hypothetical protein
MFYIRQHLEARIARTGKVDKKASGVIDRFFPLNCDR